ncbi:MAG: DUF349 domain-containing protein [Dysgonamonadaceae bacterium]|jgi:hypothetical protein|nr:DUF349 domain-containing protein [Dysgonamonadaceae bacterium]
MNAKKKLEEEKIQINEENADNNEVTPTVPEQTADDAPPVSEEPSSKKKTGKKKPKEAPAETPEPAEDIPVAEVSELEPVAEVPEPDEVIPEAETDILEVEAKPEEAESDEDGVAEDDAPKELLSIDEVVQKLRDLSDFEDPQRKQVEDLKNQFYRLLRHETEEQKATFLANGGNDIDFIASEPLLYTEGKELLQKIKDKRAEILKKEEAEKEQNVAKKLTIIEQIKNLIETQSQADFNKIYQEFKALQQQWNDVKLVPQTKVNELWKSYQYYVEKFYDLVRINNEFREYDFKKNLELKTELCEAAEKLDAEPDIVSAFHQLQKLHQQWRDIGPVAHKDREEIWGRFKGASTLINKKYQGHFEELRETENENLEMKQTLCEKIETIDYEQIKTVKDWNEKSKQILEIQTQWRQIGYVSRKWNTKIYERYRVACDVFFKNRNEFYKSMREDMNGNLRQKIALCERAEALKDSQDWQKTSQEMIALQKEWKKIGIVPRKFIDSTWKRFIEACDYFFDQKKLHTTSQHGEENKNLEAKKALIEKIKNIDAALPPEEATALLRELMEEWHQVGFVPYKMKDKIHKEFLDATDAQYNRLNINKNDRKLESFKSNISDMAKGDKGQLLREREKLMRQFERMKAELQTYENNIGFLSVSSKKGNNLIDDMNQRAKKIKTELDLLVKKIDAIDSKLQ